jgi:hypothetical protein
VVTLDVGVEVAARFKGEVKDGLFTPHLQIEGLPGGFLDKLKLKPVPVSAFGSVLNPMHPVNKLPGLREGQRWRIPKVDPMAFAAGTLLANLAGDGGAPQFLEAEVRTDTLNWNGLPSDCFLIEYREAGEKVTARTWVRRSDSLVLQQLAREPAMELVLVRQRWH